MGEREEFLRDRQSHPQPVPPPAPAAPQAPPIAPQAPPVAPGLPAPAAGFPAAPGPQAPPHHSVPGAPQPPWPDFRRVEPARPHKPRPGGWRGVVHTLTFGLLSPGPSRSDRRQAELAGVIGTPLRGHYKVGVLGKGGVGKTSVAASVGSIFAEMRPEDRIVAVDADTAFGRLGSRVDPNARTSYWELAADRNLESFADVQARVGHNAAGLYVLAGEPANNRRRMLDPAIYREAALRLDRHFAISVIDCGSTMDAAVTQEALRDLDALIVVSSPWADGAAAAAQTMEWLAYHGMSDLIRRTVVVLNDSDGHADKKTKAQLSQQFTSRGQAVVEVPFDPHLRPGGVIDVSREMASKTKAAFLQIAAAVVGHFLQSPHAPRESSA